MGDERRPSSREPLRSRELDAAAAASVAPAPERVAAAQHEDITVPIIPGRLGAYDVSKAVGKGGYAIVYKATRKSDGKIVAIKRVEIFEMTPKKRERCLQEVDLLKVLAHPNVIQMLDAFIDENQLIIVFEWAPAGDLKRLIKKAAESGRGFEESAIWEYFFQITDALRYMHSQRVMHRDIKPANVLVGAGGALKLGDLGLGRQFSEHTLEAFSKVGTPYYVSPEVVKGGGYDWKSDVWSLGCLLYELAALRSPFEMAGANLYDVFQKISKGSYPPLASEQWSEALRQLVDTMLQTDPAARPELEAVWAATRAVLQAQAKSKQDVHEMSERTYSTLLLLSSEAAALASQRRPSPLTPAPLPTLAALHPLFFAAPLECDAHSQPLQLGAAVQLVSWLVRACGKPDVAQALEAQLEVVAVPSNSSRARRSRSGRTRAASAPCALPLCSSPVRGAEAMRAAATALRINVESAPAAQLAVGHGRAVCWLLGQVAEAAVQRLQLACRDAQRMEDPPEEEAEAVGHSGDDGGNDDSVCLHATRAAADGEVEEEEAYLAPSPAMRAAAASKAALPRPIGGPPLPLVDAAAWGAEAERLAPRLAAMRLGPGQQGPDWIGRWQQLKEAGRQLAVGVPPAATTLVALRAQVAADLERVEGRESRLTGIAHSSLGMLKAAQLRAQGLQGRTIRQEEVVARGASALQLMAARLEEAQALLQERAEGLDGTRQVRALKEAICSLQTEIQHMDVRLGLAAHQLLSRQQGSPSKTRVANTNEGGFEDQVRMTIL